MNPCTRADKDPQAGQHPEQSVHDAEITTASPVFSTRCTRTPASCGNSSSSSSWPSSETSRPRTTEGETAGVMALGWQRAPGDGHTGLGGFLRPTGVPLRGHADTRTPPRS